MLPTIIVIACFLIAAIAEYKMLLKNKKSSNSKKKAVTRASYQPLSSCKNLNNTWERVCTKCGKCGRIFNKDGTLIGYTQIKRY